MSLFRLSYQGLLSSSWRPRKPPSASQVCVFACISSYFYIIISPRNWLKTSVSPTLTNYPQPAQLEESLLRHLAGVVIHGNVLLQTLKTLPLQFCIISGSQTLSRVASITSCTQGIEQVLLNIMLFKCKYHNIFEIHLLVHLYLLGFNPCILSIYSLISCSVFQNVHAQYFKMFMLCI